jgi:hypothetical protein
MDVPSSFAAPSTVVIPILTARRAMQIHHDFDIVRSRPLDDLVQVVCLPVDPWLAVGNVVRPVADGDADVIEASLYL